MRSTLLLDRVLGVLDGLFQRLRQLRLEQPVQRRFVLCLELVKRQIVLREEADRGRVHQRRHRARINERHRNAEVLVDAAELSEVGQLTRSRDVRDRREERVLDDRPKQDVGAESFVGVDSASSTTSRAGSGPLADQERVALVLDGSPAAVEIEERDAVRLGRDLRRVTALGEGGARRGRERRRSARFSQFAREDAGRERFAAGSADSNTIKPCGPRMPSSHRAKASATPMPRPIGRAQSVHHPCREVGRRERTRELFEARLDAMRRA